MNSFLKFDVKYSNTNIDFAVLLILQLFQDELFLKRLRGLGGFNHTTKTGIDVANDIANYNGTVVIKSYKPFWRWSRAIAYAQGNTIYFNSRKNHDNYYELCETIAHEIMHLIGYKHKGNYVTSYNLKTVPYMVGAMFKEHVQSLNGHYWNLN